MSDEPLPKSEIILYQTQDGRTRIQCRFEDETLWLTQALIAELFQVSVPTVNEHLKNIYADDELVAESNYSEIPNSSRRRVAGRWRGRDREALPSGSFWLWVFECAATGARSSASGPQHQQASIW